MSDKPCFHHTTHPFDECLACRAIAAETELEDFADEIERLRSALLQAYDQLRWPGPVLALETKQAIESAQQAARAAGGDS